MEKKKARFNEKIALKVFEALNKAWKKKTGIFKDALLPQERWPSKEQASSLKPKELADFLFYAALPMRGGIVSDDPFKLFWKLREKYPDLFVPKIVAEKWPPEKIKRVLNRLGSAYKDKEHSQNWYTNSLNLYKYWDGDIRNVFKYGVTEFEEAFRRIDSEKSKSCFYGMRRKIFSLLTIWLQEKKLIKIFPTPIPIDFHALRVLWATEIVDLDKWANPFAPNKKHPEQLAGKTAIRVWYSLPDQIAIWSQKFLEKSNISHLTINPAVWVLSRSLCAAHYQNSSKENATKYVEAEELLKNPNLWPKNYPDPCRICPVEEWCKWCIPSGPYYRWGILVKTGKRMPYPYTIKYLPGLEHFHKGRKKNRGAG